MQRDRLRPGVPARSEPHAPARAGRAAPIPDDLRQEIAGVLLAAVGVWLYLSLGGAGGGNLGDALAAGLRALVGGIPAWVVPGALIVLGGYLVYLRRGFTLSWRLAGALALLLALIAWVQVLAYPLLPEGALTVADAGKGFMYFENARAGNGGGLVGYAIGYPLTRLFGVVGRHVVLAAAALVGLVLAFNLSLAAVSRLLWGQARSAGSAAAAGAGRLVQAQRERSAAAAQRPAGLRPDSVAMFSAGAARKAAAAPGGAAATPAAPHLPGHGAGGATAPARPAFKIHVAGSGAEAAAPAAPAMAAGAPARLAAAAVAPPPQAPADRTADPPVAEKATAGARPAADKAPGAQTRLTRQGEHWQMALETDPAPPGGEYRLPPLELFRRGGPATAQDVHKDIMERAGLLEQVLSSFGVPAKVVEVHQGPAITRFELTVEAGVRIGKVSSLADDLSYHLAARDIRIEAPIPGKRAIGIEVPNREVINVHLRDVLESQEFVQMPGKLAVAFGKDIAGKPLAGDLEKMPHLLISGSTGSGKSVCMNAIICSLLTRVRPDELKMLMVDPKRVELANYDGIPHLLAPVCTDPRKAAGYLKWAVREMEVRYDLLAGSGTRNINGYNKWVKDNPGEMEDGTPRQPLPYIVIFIDELSDLMMVAPVEVEDCIIRLAQMARACGIHLVIATQRPSVDVITGLIKANVPSRIAFAVASQVDSRTILDMGGAEKLLGKGDMLYHPQGLSKPIRAQGAYVADREVEQLVEFVRRQGRPVYQAEAFDVEGTGRKGKEAAADAERDKESAADAAFGQAVRVVVEHGQASVSILQRRLRCNYTKAARLIDMMYERNFIGPPQGPKPRDVLISMPQWEALFGGEGTAGGEEDPDGEP